jgi:hypothetical protein
LFLLHEALSARFRFGEQAAGITPTAAWHNPMNPSTVNNISLSPESHL